MGNRLQAEPLQCFSNLSREGLIECAAVGFGSSPPSLILCIYRPPKQDKASLEVFFSVLDKILGKALRRFNKGKIFLTGDFNIDILKDSSLKSQFLNLLSSFDLHPNFYIPTRIALSSETCLDNVFTNFCPHSCNTLETGLSDHKGNFVTFDLKIPRVNGVSYSKRCFSERNIQNFLSELQAVDFDIIQSENLQSNERYRVFIGKIRLALFSAFPIKNLRSLHLRRVQKIGSL